MVKVTYNSVLRGLYYIRVNKTQKGYKKCKII